MKKSVKMLLLLASFCLMTPSLQIASAEDMTPNTATTSVQEEKGELAKTDVKVPLKEEKEKNLKAKKDSPKGTTKSNSKESSYPSDDELLLIAMEKTIDPLGAQDKTLAGVTIGEKLPVDYEAMKNSLGTKVLHKKGPFTTYGSEKANYTAYEGPAYGLEIHSGVRYELEPQTVVQIHIGDPEYKTARGLTVKESRGLTTYNYGIPQGVLQNPDTKKLVYVYGVNKADAVLAVTMDKLKIDSIDLFAPSLWENGPWPKLTGNQLVRHKLSDRDFILGGYRLQENFLPAGGIDEEWGLMGQLWQNAYVANDRVTVSYTPEQRISKVIVNTEDTVTPRGIGIGSGKILLYLNYGIPNRITGDFNFKTDPEDICYEYKNPKAYSEYLLFVVGKNGFVKSVILSDRSAEQIQMVQEGEREKDLERFLLYHIVPAGGLDSLK